MSLFVSQYLILGARPPYCGAVTTQVSRGPIYLTKQVEFAAAHRLYKDELTEEENRELFGECANPYGHGHTYVLETTIRGNPSPKTEMVLHYRKFKALLQERVVARMDHRHLNHDVAFLKGILPTSENIVYTLWEELTTVSRDTPWSLYRLKLMSSPRSWVEYFGPEGAKKNGDTRERSPNNP